MSSRRSTGSPGAGFPHSRFFWHGLARRSRLFRERAETSDRVSLTEIDRAMMRRALDLAAHAASIGEVPVGAVVYRTPTSAGEHRAGAAEVGAVAQGFNERERLGDPSAHAEFLAISRACRLLGTWRLTGMTLAVTLEPCCMCAGLIVNSRVDRVIYGARDAKAGAVASLFALLGDRRLNHRPEVIAGLFADESSDLLKRFFRERRAQRRAASGK
jgi:tRNA(adenine34) deaminase